MQQNGLYGVCTKTYQYHIVVTSTIGRSSSVPQTPLKPKSVWISQEVYNIVRMLARGTLCETESSVATQGSGFDTFLYALTYTPRRGSSIRSTHVTWWQLAHEDAYSYTYLPKCRPPILSHFIVLGYSDTVTFRVDYLSTRSTLNDLGIVDTSPGFYLTAPLPSIVAAGSVDRL